MYPQYRYNIIDYDKDGINDFSTNELSGAGRFYLFKGISKTKSVQQELHKIGIDYKIVPWMEASYLHLWKDIDQDGFLDLIVNSYYTGGGSHSGLVLFWNNKDGTFTRYARQKSSPNIEWGAQFYDINGDNLPDLINDLNIYFNDGHRSFSKGRPTGIPKIELACECTVVGYIWVGTAVPPLPSRVSIADIDNDQDSDIIFLGKKVGDKKSIYILQNDGSGNFQTYDIREITFGTYPKIKSFFDDSQIDYSPDDQYTKLLRVIDFDGDGDKDIYIGIRGVVYENKLIP